jgi:hypothetical protein
MSMDQQFFVWCQTETHFLFFYEVQLVFFLKYGHYENEHILWYKYKLGAWAINP